MSAGDSLPVLSMDAAFEAPADVVSPQQVEWRGVDWHQVLAFALMWEVVYHAGKYAWMSVKWCSCDPPCFLAWSDKNSSRSTQRTSGRHVTPNVCM